MKKKKKKNISRPKLVIHHWEPSKDLSQRCTLASGRVWMQGTGVNFHVDFVWTGPRHWTKGYIVLELPEGLALHNNTHTRIMVAFQRLQEAIQHMPKHDREYHECWNDECDAEIKVPKKVW